MFKNANQLDDFFGLKPEDSDTQRRETLKDTLVRKLSFRSRIRLLPKVLSVRERYVVIGFALLFCLALISIPFTTFWHFTVSVPSRGGSFTEGVLGEPRLANPILAQNDTDRDLARLMYASLMKYNAEGKLIPDLAKSYEISTDGLAYTIYLRTDALWQDGKSVTADDVVFTIQTIQNEDYASTQRPNWLSVTVEKQSDSVVIFRLKNKYAQFLPNLTVGILPAHLWQDVQPSGFALSELNIKPIGSGPYMFTKLTKDKTGHVISYDLDAYDKYFEGRPYIDRIVMRFFPTEDELIAAFNGNEIDNVGYISPGNVEQLKFKNRLHILRLTLPRYFALFLNQNQSKPLADKNVRLALAHAIDRQAIIDGPLAGNGFIVNSPMLGGVLDINANVKSYDYDVGLANQILDAGGWARGEDGMRSKNKEPLKLVITTSTWPEFAAVTELIKKNWQAIGVQVEVQTFQLNQLTGIIRDRSYDALLFGQILPMDPDPFGFWHSNFRLGSGLNLSLYNNKTADTLLEDARQTLNPLERAAKYDEFQNILIDDVPAIFLYSTYFIYGADKDIHGIDARLIATPSDRFADVNHWYLETHRAWR